MFVKGLCSVSFRGLSPQEIILAAKNAKLSCIEWGSDIHAKCDGTENLGHIVSLQDKYGVFCSSYGTYFRLGTDNVNELSQYIFAAKALGTETLRIWCGDRKREMLSEKENSALIEEAKKAADIACKNGVTLCMECHNNSYTQTLDGALELMETVGSETFRMYWQPNQLVSTDENIKYAKGISEYVRNIHVFNWCGSEKYHLCDGVGIWKKYLDCFDNNKTLLLEFMPDGRIETLRSEAAALEKILSHKGEL